MMKRKEERSSGRKKERREETKKGKLYKENIFPLSRMCNIKTIF
jgi:hypothetical protein